jgi:hypothetical protein
MQIKDKAIQAIHGYRFGNRPALSLPDVLSDSEHLRSKLSRWPIRAIWYASFRWLLAYEVAREFRSFLWRTGILLFRRSVALAGMGPVEGMSATGVPVACNRTHGRTQGMSRFLAVRPLATQEDRNTFLAGWNDGARWADGNVHSCTPHKGECIPPCMSPKYDFINYTVRKSMRWPAVRQSTKT